MSGLPRGGSPILAPDLRCSMTTCAICGEVITENEADAGDYCDTSTGEVHDHCLQEWQDDRDGRLADYYHDRNR